MKSRPLFDIPVEELLQYGVWEFDLEEEDYESEQDETRVFPVTELPVDDLGNRLVFTRVTLANGKSITGMFGNISLTNKRRTQVYVTLSVEKAGEWFHLARYFDSDYSSAGPVDLAKYLGLSVSEVFPVSYDISALALGDGDVIRGQIPEEPSEILDDDQRINMKFDKE